MDSLFLFLSFFNDFKTIIKLPSEFTVFDSIVGLGLHAQKFFEGSRCLLDIFSTKGKVSMTVRDGLDMKYYTG